MDIKTSQQEDVTIITINGEIQRQTSPLIQEQITPLITPHCKIVLDMSGVTSISSAGLRLLLLFYRQIEAENGRIVFHRAARNGPRHHVDHRLPGVLRHLPHYD
ncbi:MAG: STAS domain-containing protein [Chloroflexi bacterium]|nr:STAS domain-containing protein [Chloroflexota bacterium]